MNPEIKKKLLVYGIPLTIVSIALVWSISAINSPSSPDADLAMEALPTATFLLTEEDAKVETYSPSLESGGVTHPYTGVFYPFASPPPGYEDWDCFTIPNRGTTYGGALVGGSNSSTTSDTQEGALFTKRQTEPFLFLPPDPPETWPEETWMVDPGDIVCTTN